MKGKDKSAKPTKKLEAGEFSDPEIKRAVATIVAAKLEFDRVLAETPDDVKANLSLALAPTDELIDRARDLADRAEGMAKYLSRKSVHIVAQEVSDLTNSAANAKDDRTRAQYEAARISRIEHGKILQELENARERAIASILTISSSLEALGAKIVRMRAIDGEAMDKFAGDVNEELSRVDGEIRTFEESLKALGEIPS